MCSEIDHASPKPSNVDVPVVVHVLVWLCCPTGARGRQRKEERREGYIGEPGTSRRTTASSRSSARLCKSYCIFAIQYNCSHSQTRQGLVGSRTTTIVHEGNSNLACQQSKSISRHQKLSLSLIHRHDTRQTHAHISCSCSCFQVKARKQYTRPLQTHPRGPKRPGSSPRRRQNR